MSVTQDHLDRPWRVHELAHDFVLADVWNLALDDRHDFPRLLAKFWGQMQRFERSRLSRIRLWVGDKLGWDAGPSLPIPGCTEHSITTRLTDADRAANQLPAGPPSPLPSAGVRPLLVLPDEALYEVTNATIHALLHLSWPPGSQTATLAVYVKYRGIASRLYMAAIWPARHLVLYPAFVRTFERAWRADRNTTVAA